MTLSVGEIWTVIGLTALGTYLIRFSFLGLIGDRDLPGIVLKLLRYTPVAVIPGMVAPLVLWPVATDGVMDAPRLLAAIATIVAGIWSRNLFVGIGAGVAVLWTGLWLLGG